MMSRAGIFVACLVLGCWTASYALVSKLGILSTGDFRLLPPWLWITYFYRYGQQYQTIFYETLWPIYASIIAGIAGAWLSRLFLSQSKPSIAHGSSRWAHESEIIAAGLANNQGVVLGQSMESSKLFCHNGPEHVIAIAPTRGGKGVGLVIPTLFNWPASVVVFDPKGENWHFTSGYRARLGHCLCFDPTSFNTARFNPLKEIRQGELEVKDAQNIADIIVDPDGRLESRNHWQNAAHSLLVGAILHVLYDYPRKSLAGVVDLLTRPGVDFEQTLHEMAKSQHQVVQSVAQEMLNKHIEERSGVLSTALSLLALFRDPLVAQATDGHDFSISSLQEKVTSLYLVVPPSDISRLRVLLRLILNQIGRVLTEKQDPNLQRVLFLLDEFPALGRLEFFESALAYMAGYGLKAFLICQSLNQLQRAYGERNSILDNCHVRVAFANNDDQTAKRLSDLLGEQTLSKEQNSISGARFAMVKQSASTSTIEFSRPLLLPSEINRLPQDQELILVNGMFPIRAHKVRYYEDNRFIAKVLLPHQLPKRLKETESPSIESPLPIVEQAKMVGSAL